MRVSAILPAAGHGTRMGREAARRHGGDRKQFIKLGGVPVLALTVRKFLAVSSVREILVAVPEGSQRAVESMLADVGGHTPIRVLVGGPTRQESVRRCLAAVSPGTDLVAVHDAVRPFVPVDLIKRAIAETERHGAVILGMPADETVKQVSQRVVRATLPRERIMLAQTPQVFSLNLLRKAFAVASREDFKATDEASLLEHINEDVYVLLGSERNIKITRPHHLPIAKLYYEEERRESAAVCGP